VSDDIIAWVMFTIAILLIVVLGYLFWVIGRLREQSTLQSKEVLTLKQTVAALCSSSVGVDRRVNRLERQGRDLEERQETMEQSVQQGEPPYSDAIRMVHAGATPEQLVEELGISRDAADLIIMIHGAKHEYD
jgi:flagellar basal body-associated protein FliL